ncbi:MAG: L,D-transpeptidase family protein [Acidimicrobiia bacterium]
MSSAARRQRGARSIACLAVVVGLAACSGGGGGGTHAAADRRSLKVHHRASTTTTSSSSTTTSSTTVPFTGLRPGDSGPRVTDLQQKLAALHYDVSANGSYDGATMQAVMAFQKVNGLGRDGVAGDATLAKLATPVTPGPLVPGGGSTRVEVDVARQVLFFYKGDALYRIVAVSTGSGSRFCVDGSCATAVTPGGSFRVSGKVGGWQTGKLGRLYKPSYFNGNIAIHGALSVPGGPASHGCVRVPMSSADWIYASLPVGTPVYVLNGPHVPAPFSNTPPPTLPPTTATTAPPTTTTTSSTTTTSTSTTTTTTTTTAPPGP